MAKTGAAALALTMAATACTGARVNPPIDGVEGAMGPVVAAGATALKAFSGCDALLSYVKDNALRTGFRPFAHTGVDDVAVAGAAEAGAQADSATAAPAESIRRSSQAAPTTTVYNPQAVGEDDAGTTFSVTNVQEKGVDEPDVVKTDGRRIVTVQQNKLVIIDVTGAQPKKVGQYVFPADQPGGGQLLLDGDRVIVLGPTAMHDAARDSSRALATAGSGVTVLDIKDPAQPELVATLTFEGTYVSARSANGLVRMVVQSAPKGPQVLDGAGESYELAYRKAIAESTAADWIPTYTLTKAGQAPVTEPLAPCTSVLRPDEYSGLNTVSVLTFNPADPKPDDPACVLGAGGIVYASAQNLYVATAGWRAPMAAPVTTAPGAADSRAMPAMTAPRTQLHRFAIPTGQPAVYTASGEIDGTALNQFSLSEHEGRLRIATTVATPTGTDNVLHVLEAEDGKLVSVGRLAGLGHERETIHSVRFMGDRAYVVTFRRTDPLYVLDLSDPRNPVKRGELEVPGFSSYLHPLSDTALLGVGQAPDDTGGQGLQVSLFDVSDPARPVRKDNAVFVNSQSLAQGDHHAFNWWPKTGRLFMPLSSWETSSYWTGVLAMDIDPGKGFGEKKRVPHDRVRLQVERTVIVGDRLFTVAEEGLLANDLNTLQHQSFMFW